MELQGEIVEEAFGSSAVPVITNNNLKNRPYTNNYLTTV